MPWSDKGTLADFVRSALPLYGRLLREDLRPILAGESWEGGNGGPAVARAFGFSCVSILAPDGRTQELRIDSLEPCESDDRGWRSGLRRVAHTFRGFREFLTPYSEVLSVAFQAIRD